jgi:hypothetical protein
MLSFGGLFNASSSSITSGTIDVNSEGAMHSETVNPLKFCCQRTGYHWPRDTYVCWYKSKPIPNLYLLHRFEPGVASPRERRAVLHGRECLLARKCNHCHFGQLRVSALRVESCLIEPADRTHSGCRTILSRFRFPFWIFRRQHGRSSAYDCRPWSSCHRVLQGFYHGNEHPQSNGLGCSGRSVNA